MRIIKIPMKLICLNKKIDFSIFFSYNENGDSMEEYHLTMKKIWGHFNTVRRHRWNVFKLCCKVGIPFQGLKHDLSKYLPIEFFESARYYEEGKYSPIKKCKEINGYSMAWIHHKNHNKHHYEYWYDYNAKIESPIIPFKYVLEMICDSFAAGIVYQGKNWTNKYQLEYWNKVKDKAIIHPSLRNLLERVYTDVSEYGLDNILKRNNLKKLYDEYIGEVAK